jgi:hypothetical protein
MVTMSARGATGRRSTFRPCGSGFESPRADQIPGVAELAHAAASRAVGRSGPMPRVHVGSNPTAGTSGDIVEGQDSALSAREYGFESRCPRQD